MYAVQEATVRTRQGTMDWFQIGKGVHQGCILSPCLFKLCAEQIMWNAGLNEAHVGIKIAGRNINNLRYADDTTLIAESEEEVKSLLMKVKEKSEKAGLKLNIQTTRIMASTPIISWQIDGETMEIGTDIFWRVAGRSPKSLQLLTAAMKLKDTCSLEEKLWPRKWQSTPVLLPGGSHGQRSLVGYIQSMGLQRVRHNWATSLSLTEVAIQPD